MRRRRGSRRCGSWPAAPSCTCRSSPPSTWRATSASCASSTLASSTECGRPPRLYAEQGAANSARSEHGVENLELRGRDLTRLGRTEQIAAAGALHGGKDASVGHGHGAAEKGV